MSTIKFRAGRVKYDADKKLATPEPIQGQITIKPSDEDESFYSFEWAPKDNVPNVEKEELLVVPGDVTWKQVEEANTGRVFALQFLSSSARHLFWLQEINDDEDEPSALSKKDQDILRKIEKIFQPEEEEEEQPEEKGDVELPDASSTTAATTTTETTTKQENTQPIYDLNDVLTPEALTSLIDNADEDTLKQLYTHLPESFEHNKENLKTVLFSGFFKRSASNLGNALNNGGGFIVSKSLEYEYEGEGIVSFLNALRKKSKKEDK
ncbi:hypothetical protein BN7_3298 [Wickerhamomyces ciferrii]|uniref:Uncharacterized protein n=1 Tax=Wickerhamomyces ciferrii (strain ATCC 14091 / BCRC 22168 / CBS 111 / JCM 3599 / NBRC 0793 / NRRL Y-1031 F-60-10) TaxID=1206466 RepID=K0KR28_WICCF|nr:uncharacterized protein BN7_3298 [Wickerhamomyces ciferrii]CCH43744.1 hypothetical protein BN7_3298 [Wickerhamomyces ciferrii]